MKKIIALSIALAQFFLFVSCGKDTSDKNIEYSKYQELYDYLEDGEYDSAIKYIEDLREKSNNSDVGASDSNGKEENVTSGETDVPKELASYLEKLCGEWHVLYREDVGKIGTVTVKEDGTLTYDNKTLCWRYDYSSSDILRLILFDADEQIGKFELYLYEDGDICAYIEIREENIGLYKPSHYDIVEITLDNWNEYFNLDQQMFFNDNAFGEAQHCYYQTQLVTKEEYNGRLSKNLMEDYSDSKVTSGGAVEASYDYGRRYMTVDLTARSYTFGEFTAEEKRTNVTDINYNGFENCFFATLMSDNYGTYDIGSNKRVSASDNFELVRIKFTLYIIKDGENI